MTKGVGATLPIRFLHFTCMASSGAALRPHKSDSMRDVNFAASDERLLSLQPSRLFASLSDRTGGTGVHSAHGGFYVPASGRRVAPSPVGR